MGTNCTTRSMVEASSRLAAWPRMSEVIRTVTHDFILESDSSIMKSLGFNAELSRIH